jgi:hypothetical protein
MLAAKLRRAMVDPEREPLTGVVEADETIIRFRAKNDPVVVPAGRSGVGKMLVAGAVEIDGSKPRRARLKVKSGDQVGGRGSWPRRCPGLPPFRRSACLAELTMAESPSGEKARGELLAQPEQSRQHALRPLSGADRT